jgi:D-glycero-alpha-D-manno-heptose 1-phosphate guanylyltransferase
LVKEAIILAGGLGTRLRDAIPDLPKCVAPVAGQPFLKHVIRYLLSQGIEKYIFSLGHKHELIEIFLNEEFPTLDFQCSIEDEPLGTGGAIYLACKRATEHNVVIVNGDTLFKIDIDSLAQAHLNFKADCTLALKPMQNFYRYGVVELDDNFLVKNFNEKQFYETGDINGGVYVLNAESFLEMEMPQKFSFEKDYLERFYSEGKIYGQICDNYFIDIGIPEDYQRAQEELKQIPLRMENISENWTLFLDRDGVINYEKENDYIYNWDEFIFYPGALEAIRSLTWKFERVIVISNQRGVGKGLMTEKALLDIHKKMVYNIGNFGGKYSPKVYYCTAVDPKHFFRKPNPGMALQAKKDFPSIDFSKSIIVGNKKSDMQFGRNAGMYTVYLPTTHPDQTLPNADIDLAFDSLADFAKAL